MSLPFLNNFEPNVEALILFIRALKVKVTDTTINETLQNHPDFPNLLSLSDALQKWNIENVAIRADKNNLDELETPFLAHVRYPDEEFLVLVKKIDQRTVSYRKTLSQQKDGVKPRAEFIKEWSGIALLARPGESAGEKEFSKAKQKERLQNTRMLAFIGLIFLTGVLGILKLINSNSISNDLVWGYSVLLLTKIIGIFITALLVWYEIDKTNPALQKICTGLAKTNCNAVLNSKHANFLGLISWSELGFFYFAGGYISLLAASGSMAGMIPMLASLSVLALPYTFFSIYYQWRVAKQWCVLCLAVQVILISEFMAAVGFHLLLPVDVSDPLEWGAVIIAFSAPAVGWYLIKPFLLEFQERKGAGRDLSRLKFNREIFTAFMEKQKQVLHSPKGLGIVLGDPMAANTLIKVCHPYCGPCARAHPEIEKLLEGHPNLSVQIIFNVTNSKDILTTQLVKSFLAIHAKGDRSMTRKVLDDWYLSKDKDYEQFAERYPMNGELEHQTPQVEAMAAWCRSMDIQYTPTFFFNGNQLPEIYHVSDLKHILSDD